MKYILVHVGPIHKYPPAMSVLQNMSDMKYEVILCTTDITKEVKTICEERGIAVYNIEANIESSKNQFVKLSKLFRVKKDLWKNIDLVYDNSSTLWIFSDATLKHLGKELLKRKYILHMFELSEKTYYYHKLPYISMNMSKYAGSALGVIQAEYNRCHIAKAWWGLENLPTLLPNKPYIEKRLEKKSYISDEQARLVIEQLKEKKIILYQGNLGDERPLDNFIRAVDKLGNDYAFVIMSGSENIYKHIESKNYYFIPYVPSPKHLEITSHAFIGVMSYIPVENGYSKLNALYCAPNKVYEYSMFGIPMIGNDVPGLSRVFTSTKSGLCIENSAEISIIEAILKIEKDYEQISLNSERLYNNTDIQDQIKEVLKV